MKYRAIVFDIDGTITKHISSWRYIHEKLGFWENRAFHYQEDFLAGRISYLKFCQLDAAHWKGLRDSRVRAIFARMPYTKNARRSIGKLKARGFKLFAVSTGLQYLPDRIMRELSFDYTIANRLLVRNGRLTGGVRVNIAHGAKDTIIGRIVRRFGIKPSEMISVGDTEGDIPIARCTGYAIAFNSSSPALSRVVDYDCRTGDFADVYRRIIALNER